MIAAICFINTVLLKYLLCTHRLQVDAPVTCSYCGMIYKAFKPKECTKCGKVFGAGRDRRRHTLGESRQPVVARCAAYT